MANQPAMRASGSAYPSGNKKKRATRPDGSAYSSERSTRAKQLHEDGVFGGPGRGQGQKRKKRLHELVAERADKMADEVMAAFTSALDPDESAKTRMEAARRLTELSSDFAKREEQRLRFEQLQEIEDRAFDRLTNQAQAALVANMLNELPEDEAKMLVAEIKAESSGEIIDAEIY